jgi:hypothetical protein
MMEGRRKEGRKGGRKPNNTRKERKIDERNEVMQEGRK